MELLQLHYFRTVARLEHMSKAAEELRVAQPALSKTISRLEKDLGVPLFDRQGRKIRLNQFGKAYLKKTEAALGALEEGRRELSDLSGEERGSIYLATTTLDRLSEPVGRFRSLYPKVNFRITQTPMEEMELLLETGEVDFCFTSMPIERPGMREFPLLKEEIFLAIPPEHRFRNKTSISLSELRSEPFISFKKSTHFRKITDGLCQEAGFEPNVVCEVDEPLAVISLVRAGLGVAFVGTCKSRDDSPISSTMSHQSMPIAPCKTDDGSPILLHINPLCQRIFQLAWAENRYQSKAASNFRDFLVRYFEK